MEAARPIFVLGAPRSGTGLTAAYVSSSKNVFNLYEYGAFHWAASWADKLVFRHGGEGLKRRFIDQAIGFSARFAGEAASSNHCGYYVDSTPSNLLAAPALIEALGDALFILVLRRPAGVIQSLERSFSDGYGWAGSNLDERAHLWRTFYSFALALPEGRTIAFSYDHLCARPREAISQLTDELNRHIVGFEPTLDALMTSHHGSVRRPSIGHPGETGVALRPMQAFDADRWSASDERRTFEIVSDVEKHLSTRYAPHYRHGLSG